MIQEKELFWQALSLVCCRWLRASPTQQLPKCTLRPVFVVIAPALKNNGRIEVPLSKIDLFSECKMEF